MRTRAEDGKEEGMMEAMTRRTRSLNIEVTECISVLSVGGISFRGKQMQINKYIIHYNIHFNLPLNILPC